MKLFLKKINTKIYFHDIFICVVNLFRVTNTFTKIKRKYKNNTT